MKFVPQLADTGLEFYTLEQNASSILSARHWEYL